MSDFTVWLEDQMNKRKWGKADVAEKSGISKQLIYMILDGTRRPTSASCKALAKAFGVPVNSVLRIAGIAEPSSDPKILPEFFEYLEKLPLEEQRRDLNILRAIHEEQQGYK